MFLSIFLSLVTSSTALAMDPIPTPTPTPGASPTAPAAKIQGIMLNADSMFRDNERETVELEGNVQIVYQGQHIRSDKAVVHLRTHRAELMGNVEISDMKNTIAGSHINLDYENNTGIIYNGYVSSGPVAFSGTVLEKTGDQEFIVSNADYTTCTNCPASWSFSGSTVRAEMGGYAYIKNAILRVSDIPVFWFPYLVVPLKSDRQTGLLTPGFELSDNGGFTFYQPYFWAISRNTDATITLKNYEKRGLKGMLEYRYALNEDSGGILNTATLYDSAFGHDSRLNDYRSPADKNTPLERWYVKYDHYQTMPNDYVHRASVNLASDLQYPKDFPLETMNHGDSAMESRVSVTKNTKDTHTSVDTSYYYNILQADPLAGNEDAVHRLPEIRWSQVEKNIGETNFVYTINLDYVNFARSGQAYDDMVYGVDANGNKIRYVDSTCGTPQWSDTPGCQKKYDGNYDPSTDLIRTGQRLDFLPTLSYPIKVSDGIDVLPRVSYRETHYNFEVSDQKNYVRRYARTELTGRMDFSRIYGDQVDSKATRFKHEIIPEISYTNIPWIDQGTHPFYGQGKVNDAPYTSTDSISDLDLASDYGLQFDYTDRVYDRNLVTFALTNKIIRKTWLSDRPEYQQIGYLKLAQSYDGTQNNKAQGEPWSDLSATLDVRLARFQTYSIFNYYPYHGVTNASSRVRVLNDMGQFAQVALTKQYKISPGKPVDPTTRTEDWAFSAGFISRYVNLMGRLVYDANARGSTDNPKSWAYIAQFKPPGDCWMITLIQDQVTGGDTNLRLSAEFNFDGTPKPPMPPEALDQFGF
ncbi:LPS-assembly protein LptD [Bdellovibrio sp. KM01]|uniref:LPS-assembly protein LptD n=1 Tax=Bdellovibrio sp. KM01 TaxID=2748865 RepID=UPI002106B9D1|nr:LPS assembly protein LptD [Bdellovibrio sp. KM01]